MECVNCGLCLEVCPTYDLLRDEGSGPRGRIRLMGRYDSEDLQLGSWVRNIEECVGCLACQARCPAGAPFAAMLDRVQGRLAEAGRGPHGLGRWALEALIRKPERLRRLRTPLRLFILLRLPRLIQALGLHRLPGLRWLRGLHWLPRTIRVASAPPPRSGAPHVFFPGCVGGLLFPAEESATCRLLDAAGGYRLPGRWTCCGAMHRHLGDLAGSRDLARRNIAAMEGFGEALVVTQSAGCGAALKDYGRWLADDPNWAERAVHFSERVRDLSEVLVPELLAGAALPEPKRAVYDDPCHAIHAQGIAEGPRRLLDAVAGLERVELSHADRCCGAGGSYFLRHAELSREMIASRRTALDATGAELLLTANPGCRLQWEAELSSRRRRVEVRHFAELLAEALPPARRSARS